MSMVTGQIAGRIRAPGLALAVVLGLLATGAPALAASKVHRVTLAMREFALT